MNQIKRRVGTLMLLAALVLLLAACGQRGPLYLPEPEQAPIEKQSSETVDTEANKTGDDGEKQPQAELLDRQARTRH